MPTVDISITVPQDVVQAVTSWRKKQITGYTDDPAHKPILKYPTNLALLKSIIRDAILRILDQTPTVAIQVELNKIKVAKQEIKELKDGAVTI